MCKGISESINNSMLILGEDTHKSAPKNASIVLGFETSNSLTGIKPIKKIDKIDIEDFGAVITIDTI